VSPPSAPSVPPALRRTALACALAGATALAAAVPAGAVTPPRRDIGPAIEDPAPYQPRFLCSPTLKPGVTAFRDLVLKAYKGTASVSEARPCSPGSTSEHMDGRAWDWGVDVTKPKQKAQAQALLGWLLAEDEYGNDFAMARRLGVMYVIWDKRQWSSYRGSWRPYPCSGATACHRDHMHVSFGWAGARKKTSYWDGTVSAVLPPPIPVFDATGESWYVKVPATKDQVWGSKALKAGRVYALRAAGVWRRGASEDTRADAACVYRPAEQTWERASTFRMSGVWQWLPTTDTGGGCNTKDHTYVATLLPGITDAVSFAVQDGKRSDNGGAVTVRIRRLV
jgi:hypothetical protein